MTVQYVMSGKHRSKKQKHFFPIRGFMFCHSCGCLMTASTKKGHVYYYCTNGKGKCEQHKKYLRDKKADELVAGVFEKLKFNLESVEIVYLACKEKILLTGSASNTRKDELSEKLKTTQAQLANLVQVISIDPGMANALKPQILSLEADTKNIQTQISNIKEPTLEQALFTLEQIKKTFLQANSASFDYLEGDPIKKNNILKESLWNLKIENQIVQQYQFKTPFSLLAESPKNLVLSDWLGLANNIITYWQTTTERFYIPSLSPEAAIINR